VDDVTRDDVTRRGNDVTGEEEENDVTVDDVPRGMKMFWVRKIM